MTSRPLVLDTNVVLDVFLFDDAAARPILPLLEQGALHWVSTPPMRNELERVLAYAQIQAKLGFYSLTAADVLAGFDRHAHMLEVAPKARFTCTDGDDQKFIDLAVAHRALLLSKDAAVLKLRKRLATLDVTVAKVLPALSYELSAT